MILENTIKKASKVLKENNIPSYELDAEIILSNLMGVTREFLMVNNNLNVTQKVIKKYDLAIERRVNKEPVAYIIGQKEFWSENFLVNKKTLVPRPETELLIYKLIDFYKYKKINILDIGTGSGCILLALLKELKNSRGTGLDISAEAIKIAKINAKKLNLFNRAKLITFDFKKFKIGKFDLIVSNPPYISSRDLKKLTSDIIQFEPRDALDGGIDGLDLIKKVIYKSNYLLKRNGTLALEIGFGQYKKVSKLLKYCGYREISKEYDYKHNVRCIISTKVNFFNIKK